MSALAVTGRDEVAALIGAEIPPTPWLTLSRERHLLYDEATFHVPSTNYPGGEAAQWAHGSHTLSLIAPLFEQTVAIRGFGSVLLYGFDRVRFPAGVRLGARVRVHFGVADVADAGDGLQCRVRATVECDGVDKPACVAEMLLRLRP